MLEGSPRPARTRVAEAEFLMRRSLSDERVVGALHRANQRLAEHKVESERQRELARRRAIAEREQRRAQSNAALMGSLMTSAQVFGYGPRRVFHRTLTWCFLGRMAR